MSGPAAGATGTVVGKHAFVLVDFPQTALDALAPGDRMLVRAHGQGLRLLDFPELVPRSCSPALVHALPFVCTAAGKLRVEVAAEIPAYMMGAGIGMSSEWANCDVMFTHRDTVDRLGVGDLRLGDVVVMWTRIIGSGAATAPACARSGSSPTAATARFQVTGRAW